MIKVLLTVGFFVGSFWAGYYCGFVESDLHINSCQMEVSELSAELEGESSYNMQNELVLQKLLNECQGG